MKPSELIQPFTQLYEPRVIVNRLGATCYYIERRKLHRQDGPAVIAEDGTIEEWWVDGNRHREGDLPAFIGRYAHGSTIQSWWVKGKRHRLNGPAIIAEGGREEYWVEGKFVR